MLYCVYCAYGAATAAFFSFFSVIFFFYFISFSDFFFVVFVCACACVCVWANCLLLHFTRCILTAYTLFCFQLSSMLCYSVFMVLSALSSTFSFFFIRLLQSTISISLIGDSDIFAHFSFFSLSLPLYSSSFLLFPLCFIVTVAIMLLLHFFSIFFCNIEWIAKHTRIHQRIIACICFSFFQ